MNLCVEYFSIWKNMFSHACVYMFSFYYKFLVYFENIMRKLRLISKNIFLQK